MRSFCCCFLYVCLLSVFHCKNLVICCLVSRCGIMEWGKTTVYVMRMQIESRQTKWKQRNVPNQMKRSGQRAGYASMAIILLCTNINRGVPHQSIDRFIWTEFHINFSYCCCCCCSKIGSNFSINWIKWMEMDSSAKCFIQSFAYENPMQKFNF